MSKAKLDSIKALTFYQGEETKARRSRPISQLTCIGKPCKLYQPEVVRCTNIGGRGTDVEWKCEADLPESLRFGRVEVSCEGWSAPGDPYVLQNSCGLEYRLVEVPRILRSDSDPHSPRSTGALNSVDWPTVIFAIPWVIVLLWILYGLCWQNNDGSNRSPRAQRRRGPGPGFSDSNWFPGGYGDDRNDPPPPYHDPKHATAGRGQGWSPGFFTGALAGGLAGRYLFNNNRRDVSEERPRRRIWDWERPTTTSSPPAQASAGRRVWSSGTDDRGEGTSDLGSMRRSSGFGGSNVR
ncbi:hypothetical protein AAF712_007960 [Marasmius tenuissimus]|uniref:Store-operated calcium entry-associated regulatory factor n=1 Tax=Marasmius tenuissimus TaxID=585030 RepID=A0ABR2ZWG3_9AGAR